MATTKIIPDNPVYQEDYYAAAVTTPIAIARPSWLADALPLLGVGAAFLICLAAIGAGVYLSVTSHSQAIAVLAAFGCAGVIYALLSPSKE